MIGKFFKKLLGTPATDNAAATAQPNSGARKTEAGRSPKAQSQDLRRDGARQPDRPAKDARSKDGAGTDLRHKDSRSRRDGGARSASAAGRSTQAHEGRGASSSRGARETTPEASVSAAPRAASTPDGRAPKRAPKPVHTPWDISEFVVPEVEGKARFHDFNLAPQIVRAVQDLGFSYCSPIQAQSLPHALDGRDVVGKAQTGTGKTAAFLTSSIDYLLKNPLTETRYAGEARVLIIAPTRELVMQIAEDAKLLCKYTDLQIHALVGGMDYAKQQRHLHEDYVDILVATPGRLLDFCGNKDVYLDQLEILVIDEADRMLDMGFIPQVRNIVRQTPHREERQTLFFSATFTDDVHNLVQQWTYQPVTVEIEPESVANARVEQHVYLVSNDEKYTVLYNLIQQEHAESMIVFANRRDECRDLHEQLQRHGIKAGLLSGEIAQNKRVSTLEQFKSGEIKVLVATDVAGRGIHISGISHVVNFTLPEEPEDYVHRIGRTGRAGKSGTSISFASEDDALRLAPIEVLLGNPLKCEQPPEVLLLEPPMMAAAPLRERSERYSRSVGSRSGNRGRRPR